MEKTPTLIRQSLKQELIKSNPNPDLDWTLFWNKVQSRSESRWETAEAAETDAAELLF